VLGKLSGRYAVALPSWRGSVAKIRVNGHAAGYIYAPPYECDVTRWLKRRENQIEVVVIGTLKNTLGPHHGHLVLGAARPVNFQQAPNPGPPPGSRYSTVAYGLFEPFILRQRHALKPEYGAGFGPAHFDKFEASRQPGPVSEASLPTFGEIANRTNYLAAISEELNRQWPTNRTVNIVCHGHSVPAGYFQTPTVDTFNAYPHLLHCGLKERFPYAVLNVITTAIGGEDSVSGARRFERDVLALRPDVVTIDYAGNDRRIGLEPAETAWRAMIRQAQSAGAKVILLTPTPDLRAKLDDPLDPLNQHAEQIRRLARECGVGLVDSLALFQERERAGVSLTNLMSQVNHPNRAGHELVAAALLRWFP